MLNPSGTLHPNPALHYWVGKGSPIRELVKLQRRPSDFRFHVWGTRISQDLEARLPETADRFVGCGISEDNEQAIAAACGEALERYVFALTSDLVENLPLLEPDDSFSPDFLFKLPFLLPRTLSRQAWCEQAVQSPRRILPAWQLKTDGQRIPTQLPVEFLTPTESFSLFQTTNGMACGVSLEDAITRGLKETIERDALMLVWLYRAGGRAIAPETLLPNHYLEQVRRMEHQGIITLLRDISTDLGYRVILAIVGHFPETGQPTFAFGAGADTNPYHAARHAFREACLGWKGVSWRVGVGGWHQLASEGQEFLPRSFVQHSAMYFEPEMLPKVSFLFERQFEADRQGETEATLSPALDSREIFVLDLTTPDVRAMGAYVVKVIVLGLVPFYVANLASDELAVSRLPTQVGGTTISLDRPLNTMPHPWP